MTTLFDSLDTLWDLFSDAESLKGEERARAIEALKIEALKMGYRPQVLEAIQKAVLIEVRRSLWTK